MKALLVAALVAAGANSMHVSQLAGGGGAVTGTGEILTDALYCEAPTSDIDALACALRGASAYPQGTHAAGILYLGGGEGITKIAITAANCVGNYVDIGCNGLTATRFHYGAGLDFEGATDTLAAASLATNATTLTDVLATDVTGTVYLLPDATCVSIELATDDATCAAITDGGNAGVVIRGPLTVTGAASVGGVTTTGANSEAHACAWHSTTLTFAANPGDASKTATGLIPAGSVLHAIATRVLVTGTNCTTVDIGDGVDADLFGNDIAVAAGTTTNDASWTAQVMNPQLTAGDVVITGNVNCFDYSARVSAFYCTTTAPAD
jgi:hypothetical protein